MSVSMGPMITPRGHVGMSQGSIASPIQTQLQALPHYCDVAQIVPGTLVSPANVHMFYNHQIRVRTTLAYRTALGSVADPAATCVGVVVKINAHQVDHHGNGMRVDVLWDNGRPLQGYRVGYAKAHDLEAAEPRKPDANPHPHQSPVSESKDTIERKSIWRRIASGFKSPFFSKRSCKADDGVLQVSVGFLAAPKTEGCTFGANHRASDTRSRCKTAENSHAPGSLGCGAVDYKNTQTVERRAADARGQAPSPALSPALSHPGQAEHEVSPSSTFYRKVNMPHGWTSANPSSYSSSRAGSPHILDSAVPWPWHHELSPSGVAMGSQGALR
jgi:hypothetical protein